jgi:hypothetical protein
MKVRQFSSMKTNSGCTISQRRRAIAYRLEALHIGQLLPPGATGAVLRDVAFFHGHGEARPILALACVACPEGPK